MATTTSTSTPVQIEAVLSLHKWGPKIFFPVQRVKDFSGKKEKNVFLVWDSDLRPAPESQVNGDK
jgi:hypothetical protein